MFEVGLPMHLRHREVHGNLPLLFTNLEHLQELLNENHNEVHAGRISEILLWIATNHPEVLKGDAKLLSHISIVNLCFRDSYERLDELIPTEALTTLLNSRVCKKLENFCGYVNPQLLDMNSLDSLETINLAMGKHNVHLFTQEPSFFNDLYAFRKVIIHLLCNDLNHKELPSLPIYHVKTVYISNVSDHDVAWVLQAAFAFDPQNMRRHSFLKLKHSKLTATGVLAIANGLFEAGLKSWSLGVSSPHIGHYEDDYVTETPEYGETEQFLVDRISWNYNIYFFTFNDNEYEEEFLFERLEIIEFMSDY